LANPLILWRTIQDSNQTNIQYVILSPSVQLRGPTPFVFFDAAPEGSVGSGPAAGKSKIGPTFLI